MYTINVGKYLHNDVDDDDLNNNNNNIVTVKDGRQRVCPTVLYIKYSIIVIVPKFVGRRMVATINAHGRHRTIG